MKPIPGWRPTRRPPSPEDEVDRELEFHLDGLIEELRAGGLSNDAARVEAQRRFGDWATVRASCLDLYPKRKSRTRGLKAMRLFVHDLRYAIRGLAKRPGYTLSIVATLALAIGATTAVFSVVHGVLLQPLPIPDPQRVVRVWEVDMRPGFFDDKSRVTVANYGDWVTENRVFEAMAAYQQYPVTLRGEGDPRPVVAAFVSQNFFKVLGIQAARGRTFLPEEDAPDAQTVLVISHRFWERELGRNPDVLSQTLGVDAGVYPIIGVLPPTFDQLDQGIDVVMPLGLRPSQFDNRRSHVIHVLARIKDDVSLAEAQRDMDRVVTGLRVLHPEFLEGWGVNVRSLSDAIVGDIKPALLILQAGAVVLLIIATVNVTNLMLARTVAEQRELAIRTALGAARNQLVAHKVGEAVTLAGVSGVLGTLFAHGATKILLALAPASLPLIGQVRVSWPVLAFALSATALTTLAFVLAPALQASHTNVSRGLTTRNAPVSRGHHRFRAALVIAQLAFSLTLLISAGLLVKTFVHLMAVDPGFNPAGTATTKITLPYENYTTSVDQAALYERILDRVRALPGVTAAGATKFLPLVDDEWTWSVTIEGQPDAGEGEKRDYGRHAVMPGYFEAMNIAVREGRAIVDSDRGSNNRVAVVNEAFVNRFFSAGQTAVGRRMSINGEDGWITIVGVVNDVHQYALDADPQPAYYAPLAQFPDTFRYGTFMHLVLRTSGDPRSILNPVRDIVRGIDPSIVVSDFSTMRDHLAMSVARSRFAMTLLTTFALIAAVLATIGVYGVVSYAVGQRTPEIGVRLALGARGTTIVRGIVGGALRMALAGVAIGIVTAGFATRFQASLLFGVSALDPATYGVVAFALILIAAAAAFVPAYRASRTDPVRVLRNE